MQERKILEHKNQNERHWKDGVEHSFLIYFKLHKNNGQEDGLSKQPSLNVQLTLKFKFSVFKLAVLFFIFSANNLKTIKLYFCL